MGHANPDWWPGHKLSVDAYHRLGDAGVIKDGERLELIEGEVLEMSPIGSRQAGTVSRLASALRNHVQAQSAISVQNPRVLSDREEVWLVSVEDNSVTVYLNSDGSKYLTVDKFSPGNKETVELSSKIGMTLQEVFSLKPT